MSSSNNPFQTPEAVAYQLMNTIFYAEGKLNSVDTSQFAFLEKHVTREYILSTYKECLAIVKSSS